ncbi:MAG: carbohydrate ABC transporter permease [Kiritimatiellae bacterium]|nr:carbohydrate ABC transporter permease [Kiritimatiellia bacterium]
MAVLLESERKSAKARIFLAIVYSILTLGGVCMILPFSMMLAGSLASDYDTRRDLPFITALFDRNDRFMRSIAARFRRFPREIYPGAPEAWTIWSEVAKDREGIRRFGEEQLGPAGGKMRPATDGERERARRFLKNLSVANPEKLVCRHDPRDTPRFLKARYGTIEKMNAEWIVPHKSFFDASFAAESRTDGTDGFVCPDPEKRRAWLDMKKWYVENAIAGGDFVSRTMPRDMAANAAEIRNALVVQFKERGMGDLLREAAANYRLVLEYLFIRGRAFFNTLVLVVLSVLVSLTVNPLAAYALSRFRLASTEKIILFLLATSAFPAAVTAIPGFLLMRDLGLLNTFAALVLPGAASGMSIFILKGFFDALPRELYEAAEIDGAPETTVFLRITLPMAKPILAVNALNSFLHAYASWEWAFLVCNKESHWTLAVWLYQMSAETFISQPWCVMAAFAVVSIPTAAVFIMCQKLILRGIVLPTMK